MLLTLFLVAVAGEETGRLVGMTNQHNYYRCLHGMPLLKWSDELQASAEAFAKERAENSCIAVHSATEYGENILWSHAAPRAGPETVDVWYNENPNPNSGGGISDIVDAFNQVVWRSTTELGCAVAVCQQEQAEFVVCHYKVKGNVGTNVDAQNNIDPYARLPIECQTIADGHDAGMFISPETDETNPAGLAVGAAIGGASLLAALIVVAIKRDAWFKWTSAKLANQQPLVLQLVTIALQIIIFALLVRSIEDGVAWVWVPDGSTLSPDSICMMRTANGVPGTGCVRYDLATICSHEYTCHALDAAATARIFVVLACVASWLVLVVEACLAIPQVPLEPMLGASIAIFGAVLQFSFVWLTLWFYGGYLVSYFSGIGFPIADEGTILLMVTLPIFVPLIIITSAQKTLHTK